MQSDKSRSKFIDSGQIIVMTVIFGILYCVSRGAFDDCGAMLANYVVSALIIAVLAIPLTMLTYRAEGNVPSLIADKSVFAGKISAVLYLVYFLSAAADFLRAYAVFVSERYFHEAGTVVCIILAGIVCVYISWAGIETVCRMSTVMLFMLVLASAVFAAFAFDDFSCPGITARKISLTRDGFGGIFPYAAAAAVSMCIVCGGAGRRTRAGIYVGAAALLAASSAVTAAVFAVLGDFTGISEYPMPDAVIYAARNVSFRPDGMFFALWTLIAAAAVSLLCACGGASLKIIFPKIKGEGIYSSAAAVIIAIVCALTGSRICAAIYGFPAVPVILLGVIPLITLLIYRKNGTAKRGKGKGKS